MKRLFIPSLVLLGTLSGCVQSSKIQKNKATSTRVTPKPSTDASIVLSGTLRSGGESRGKTLAAWSGIPVGTSYYYLEVSNSETLIAEATSPILVQSPPTYYGVALVDTQVHVLGTWRIPAAVVSDDNDMMQKPISVSNSGETTVVAPLPVFVATSIQAIQ